MERMRGFALELHSHFKSQKLNWTAVPYAALSACITAFCTAVVVFLMQDIPSEDAGLKVFFDRYGFNLIGDTLAGLLGVATLIVVVVTYRTQKLYAEQTISDMQKQNALDEAVANANYRLGLFDLRKKVFDKLVQTGTLYASQVSEDMVELLRDALFDAQFVFSEELHGWILEMLNLASTLRMNQLTQMREEERRAKGAGWYRNNEYDYLNRARRIQAMQRKLHKNLLSQPMFDRFSPYMRMTETIEIKLRSNDKVSVTAIKQ